MSQTFDNKRVIKPVNFEDVDKAFHSWWNDKLNLHLTNDKGEKIKVPVHFVAPERWNLARREGVRDRHGVIILPIIAISKTRIGGTNETPYNRIVADTQQEITYYKKVHPKSSLIKELNNNRTNETVDPSLPIYEVYTTRTPDHYVFTYEVSIWTSFFGEMNEIMQKVAQEYNYLSVKSFKFETPEGFYFVAFQDDELTDESNLDDFTDEERIVRRNIVFNVPAHIMPESDERKPQFKRRLSQTKLVFTNEVVLKDEE